MEFIPDIRVGNVHPEQWDSQEASAANWGLYWVSQPASHYFHVSTCKLSEALAEPATFDSTG